MPGFDFDPAGMGPPLARDGYLVVVQRYDPDEINNPLSLLPNVQCLSVAEYEGRPAVARFKYILDDSGATPGPDGFEDLIPVVATGPNVVQQGDRLTVTVAADGGPFTVIFDGFAEMPQVGLDPKTQHATFQAQSVAVRLWDDVIGGAVYRNADTPTETTEDIQTDLPARFNPDDQGKEPIPNSTPLGADAGGGDDGTDAGSKYPVFIDPRPAEETSEDEDEDDGQDDDEPEMGDTRKPWTLADATKYLLWQGNPDQGFVNQYPTNALATTLQAVAPAAPGSPIDPTNPATFKASDIIVRDFDASNKPCMDSIKALLWPHGLRYRFRLTPYSDGSPKTNIMFYRRDGLYGVKPKPFLLQAPGQALDPGQSNVSMMSLSRESVRYNQVEIETDPVVYEVSVILAPGFAINAADSASVNALKPFLRSSWLGDAAGMQANRDAYRLFIFDECGDGHWDFSAGAIVKTIGDAGGGRTLNDIFNADLANTDIISAHRYRPGERDGNLITKLKGRPLQFQLDVARVYGGTCPGIHDGSGGPWQPIASGDWRPLRSRLGIRFVCDNPNDVNLGTPPAGAADVMGRGGKLKLIEVLGNRAASGSPVPFYLRYTVTIRADRGLGVTSQRRIATPTPFTLTTRIDCRDHYRKAVVDQSSPYYTASTYPKVNNQAIIRDDTVKAQAYADAIRAAGELGEWRGMATIPRFSLAYDIGDRIYGIKGRTASFQQNAGTGAGEGPSYPIIVGRTFNFENQQSTTLEFASDNERPTEA